MDEFLVVHKSIPRVDGLEKVSGVAKYANDFALPRMLYGKVLRSPYPHARIANIDISRAQKLPGVRAVLTSKDMPEGRMGLVQERHLLTKDVVRFVGEPVALVAAESMEVSEEALDLIEVEYEELPAVFDTEEAIMPHPKVVVQPDHHRLPATFSYPSQYVSFNIDPELDNVYRHYELSEGNVERGFGESDLVIEHSYEIGRTQHCAMEPHCAMARPDPDGGFTLWASEQRPFEAQEFLSRIFQLPKSKIRVIAPYIGGGFGGKLGVMVSPWAVLLAQKTCRPVKVVYSREEVFVDGLTDVPMLISIKDGVRKDGTLLARKVRSVLNCGAYANRVILITEITAMSATLTYRIPNFRFDSYCVATNEPVSGAFRGFGGVPMTFAIESQMDMLARGLGMDPYEFRRMNLYKEGEINLIGRTTDNTEAEECLDKVAKWIGWGEKVGKRDDGPWRTGSGIAAQANVSRVSPYSLVDVKVYADGTVEIRHSATEIGQGCNTVLAQIAAEEFQTSIERVRQISADTAVTPYDLTSTANLTTFGTGNSLRLACRDAKRQILEVASERLKVGVETLEIRDGMIQVSGRGEAVLKLADLFVPGGGGTARRGEIIGKGVYMGRKVDKEEWERAARRSWGDYTFCYGAYVAEVAVNIETGEVKVQRLAQCHDMGTPINPQACEAQMEGGTGMGVGRALYEDVIIENGVVVNPNFVDYKVPSMMEVPLGARTESILPAGLPHKDGPYGAKGFGESTNCGVAPAIANAIYDAVGIRIKELPITREKILAGLRALMEEKVRGV